MSSEPPASPFENEREKWVYGSGPGSLEPGHAGVAATATECVCAEINTRHCPVHGQGEAEAAATVDPHRDPMLDAIYADGDPIIFLRVDLYRTARRAKQVAWSGDGIPYGFREDGALLKDLRVIRVWMRDDGAKHGYDQWWTQVNVTDVADLTEFFRVEPWSNV